MGSKCQAPELPRVATQPGLEDAHRPGHFCWGGPSGATPCSNWRNRKWLFLARRIGSNCNSSKPWWIETAAPAFMPSPHRAADGLARSSRNERLSDVSRQKARAVYLALQAAAEPIPLPRRR